MRKINELFHSLSKDQVDSVLKEYNIEVPEGFLFSNVNLVIGKNGSGKTRFLNALKKLYRLNNTRVVYGYFPEISFEKRDDEEEERGLPDYSLIDSIMDNTIEFNDFFKEIQNQSTTLFDDLMVASSNRQKNRNDRIFNAIEEAFLHLTEYRIKREGRELILIRNGKEEKASEVLKEFSPGELILFYFSIFISLQTNKKKVIILDEPEGHLHTQAFLSFLRLLKQSDCYTDLWIATHSLFTIPEFEFDNIVYIENGGIVKRNSGIYNNMLETMIGENYQRVNRFLTDLNQWAYSEYIDECFEEPGVIDTVNPKDEQVELFVKFLEGRKDLMVLDYGAGKARLGRSCLKRKEGSKITYEVYDIQPRDDTYGFKYYESAKDIPRKHYDCVVLMNVLHELDPMIWRKEILTTSRVLKDDGYLLFVETSVLNKGEMPNKTGYIVLGKEELEELFGVKGEISEIKIKENQKSVCLAVPQKILALVTMESIVKAIERLKENTYNNLKKERVNGGRKYAFYSQLYINTTLFLEKRAQKVSRRDRSNTTVRDYNTMIREIKNYLETSSQDHFYEFMLVNSTKELINIVPLSEEEKDAKIKTVWSNVGICQLENGHQQTIAIALLVLALNDYLPAKREFKQKGYEQFLPPSIQRLRRTYVDFLNL